MLVSYGDYLKYEQVEATQDYTIHYEYKKRFYVKDSTQFLLIQTSSLRENQAILLYEASQ
jgi:hypothetical protein